MREVSGSEIFSAFFGNNVLESFGEKWKCAVPYGNVCHRIVQKHQRFKASCEYETQWNSLWPLVNFIIFFFGTDFLKKLRSQQILDTKDREPAVLVIQKFQSFSFHVFQFQRREMQRVVTDGKTTKSLRRFSVREGFDPLSLKEQYWFSSNYKTNSILLSEIPVCFQN